MARELDPELDIWTVCEPVLGDFVRREAGPLGKLEDLREGFEETVATVRKLPGLVTRAEAALDDYDAEKRSPQRGFNRFMFVAGFWLIVIVALVYLVRVVFNL